MNSEVSEKIKPFTLQSLIQYIEDNCFDIVGEEKLSTAQFSHIVYTIGNRFRFYPSKKVTDYKFKMGETNYSICVNNRYKGFVRVINEYGVIGICETEFYPFYKDDEGWYSGFCNLAQMINESWYAIEND